MNQNNFQNLRQQAFENLRQHFLQPFVGYVVGLCFLVTGFLGTRSLFHRASSFHALWNSSEGPLLYWMGIGAVGIVIIVLTAVISAAGKDEEE